MDREHRIVFLLGQGCQDWTVSREVAASSQSAAFAVPVGCFLHGGTQEQPERNMTSPIGPHNPPRFRLGFELPSPSLQSKTGPKARVF